MKKAGLWMCAAAIMLWVAGCRETPGNPSDATGGNRNMMRTDTTNYNDGTSNAGDTGEFSGDLDGGIPR